MDVSLVRHILAGVALLGSAAVMDAQDGVPSVLVGATDSLEQSVTYEEVDSSYMREIEQLVEKKQKEKEAKAVVEMTERKLLYDEMSFNTEGALPLLRGLLMKFTENKFNKRPAVYRRYDMDLQDYGVAGAPLATSWLLKTAGVESRSSTKRMLLSNAMALALSASIVKGVKSSVSERRPDDDGDDAFPSGHSSFAFVGATILHREFGHHSPWISVGGYATATATQVLRMRHNRHWAHDTFVGAGIGVVSTNLAYFITDRILGEKHINRPRFTQADLRRVLKYNTRPSSFSFISGTEIGNRTIEHDDLQQIADFDGKAKVYVGAGLMAGVEGTWFVSPGVAFDATLKLTTSMAKISMSGASVEEPSMNAAHLDFYRFSAGVRYSFVHALSHRFSFRLFAGTRSNASVNFSSANDGGTTMFRIPAETRFDSGVSVMYDCITTKKYSYGFNFDYHHTDSDIMPHRYGVSTVWKILL